jgi:hypothetical protein
MKKAPKKLPQKKADKDANGFNVTRAAWEGVLLDREGFCNL